MTVRSRAPRHRHAAGVVALVLALTSTLLAGVPVRPPTAGAVGPFAVTTTADTVDAAPGNGTCADAGGECSLRAAVQEANATPGHDQITLPAGTYTLTRTGRNESATATTGDLDLTGPTTITGAGPLATTIDANNIDRILEARTGAPLTLTDLTLRGGNPGLGLGGAILTAPTAPLDLQHVTLTTNTATIGGALATLGPLTTTDTTITHNTATGGGGGGAVTTHPTTTLTTTTLHANTATGPGGGLATTNGATLTTTTITDNTAAHAGGLYATTGGTLTITDTTITDNTATGTAPDGQNGLAGGIGTEIPTTIDTTHLSYNDADLAGALLTTNTTTITNTTIDHNNADTTAAGLAATNGTLTLTNTTISSNTTPGTGGGLTHLTTAHLTHTTITNNLATTGAGLHTLGTPETGGPHGTTTLTNTIIANQLAGPDCSGTGTTTSHGHNITTAPATTCGLTDPTDRPDTDPHLAPLADNGGPTPTHALQPLSPALDTIPIGTNSCGTNPPTDQRGQPRLDGLGCDPGAVESAVQPNAGAYNFLGTGNDPADILPGGLHENLWLAVSGPCASRENGELLQAVTDATYIGDGGDPAINPGPLNSAISWEGCATSHTLDNTDGTPDDTYDPDGYFYAVTVPAAGAGETLSIEIYDAPQCSDGNGPFPSGTDGQNFPDEASNVYQTAYTVRGPDTNPGLPDEPEDDPVLSSRTFTSNQDSAACGTDGTDWQNTWRTLHTVTDVDPGRYLVQVRTSGGVSGNDHSHASNQFSLRAHYGTSWDPATSPCSKMGDTYHDPACPTISTLGWQGVYANLTGSVPSFRLNDPGALPPGGTLEIELWDPGEGMAGLQVTDPLGRAVDFDWEVVNLTGTETAPTGGWSGTVTQPGGVPCDAIPASCASLDVLGTPNTGCDRFGDGSPVGCPSVNGNQYYQMTTSDSGYWRGWNPQPGPYRGSRSKYSDRLVRLTVELPASPAATYGAETRFRLRYLAGPANGASTDRGAWRVTLHGAAAP